MIDTQRLGAYLRALMREDAALARFRTAPVMPPAPLARVADDADVPSRAPVTGGRLLDDGLLDAPGVSARRDDASVDRRAPAHDATAAARVAPELGARGSSAPARAAVPTDGAPSAALALSAAGLVLRDLLRVATAVQPAPTDDPAPAAARPARALLGVPPHSQVATDRLALNIKDTVEFSGVFYESHLAQWADEVRPRELLALEPQSKWTTSSADHPASRTAGAAEVAAPLVRRQLDVLDSGRFLWRGDLWPGQPGALVIEEDDRPARRDPLDSPAGPAARIRIELTLPGLGRIHASVGLAGDTLDVAVRCEEPRAASALREAATVLRTAIGVRALDIASLAITDGHA